MGKGAGGCNDRPAFSLDNAVLVGETAVIEDRRVAREKHDTAADALARLYAHREQYPLNDLIALGSPPSDDSDRVRFRKMFKYMSEAGYRISSWEGKVDDPQIEFQLPNPRYTNTGKCKHLSRLRVTFNGDWHELAPFTQDSLIQFGFPTVISTKGNIIPLSHSPHQPPHALEVLLAEYEVHKSWKWMQLQSKNPDLQDDAVLAQYTAFAQSDAFYEPEEWLAGNVEIDYDEAILWANAGINRLDDVLQWQEYEFDVDEAGQWNRYIPNAEVASLWRPRVASPLHAVVSREMNIAPDDPDPFTPEQWEMFRKTVDTFPDRRKERGASFAALGADWRKHEDSDRLMHQLEWMQRGHSLATSIEPADYWHPHSMDEAAQYIKAGFLRPLKDVPVEAAQAVATWGNQVSLRPVELLELHEAGVTPETFQQYRQYVHGDRQVVRAIEKGWSPDDLLSWKEFFELPSRPSLDHAAAFRKVGATPKQAVGLAKRKIHPHYFAELQKLFNEED